MWTDGVAQTFSRWMKTSVLKGIVELSTPLIVTDVMPSQY